MYERTRLEHACRPSARFSPTPRLTEVEHVKHAHSRQRRSWEHVCGCARGGACSTVDMSAATICRASRVVLTATGSCAHALRWHSGAGNTDDRAAPHTALRVPRVCMSARGSSTLVARAPGSHLHHGLPRSSTSSTRTLVSAARGNMCAGVHVVARVAPST